MSIICKNNIVNSDIFRKNDIRGKVPEDLNSDSIKIIGQAFGKFVLENTNKIPSEILISIGYDVRLHSQEISEALISGITSLGINVINLNRCPTPVVYFSSYFKHKDFINPDASIMITGSHNPPKYNGLKMCLGKDCLKSDDINKIKDLCNFTELNNDFLNGSIINYNLNQKYITYLNDLFKHFKNNNIPIKIVVDSGNGCAGEIVPPLLRELGCEVIELFSEPDGNFPNHHPDPTVISNLKCLINKVVETKADFGVAYDGDADRLGIIDNNGNVIPGDMLMLLFSMDILNEKKYHNPTFISEVKCSQILYDTLAKHNANIIMWKTGHSFIKEKMKLEDALLAGEMSGHLFFADRYYGYDDAIYATCRLIEIVIKNKNIDLGYNLNSYFQQFPKTYNTPEIRLKCDDKNKFQIVENFKNKLFKEKEMNNDIIDIITIDGVRVVFNDGFGLVRASNTEPILVLRFEALTENKLFFYKDYIEKLLMFFLIPNCVTPT